MFFKCVLILVLFSNLDVVEGLQSSDFCEAFAENRFRISCGYGARPEMTYLFIGDHYWFVERNSVDATLSLQSSISKVYKTFKDEFVNAVYYKICKGGQCEWMTGLRYVRHLSKYNVFKQLNLVV